MLLASHKKNENNCLTIAFVAQKPKAIFANFGQLWRVVYTAKIKFLDFLKCIGWV
jgi:hypothetical protein